METKNKKYIFSWAWIIPCIFILLGFLNILIYKNTKTVYSIGYWIDGIILLPPIITLLKSKLNFELTTKKKLILIFFTIILCLTANDELEKTNSTHKNNNDQNVEETIITNGEPTISIIHSLNIEQLIYAMNQLGVNYYDYNSIEELKEWTNGYRFRIVIGSYGYLVYTDINGNIESIYLNDFGNKIYQKGYKGINISNIECTQDERIQLQILAEDKVKGYLNYPNTASFKILSWQYAKYNNIYYVSGYVNAKNGFGVKDSIPFSLQFKNNDNKLELIYFEIDSKNISGNPISLNCEKIIDDEYNKIFNNSNNEEILKYDELGKYGREVYIDGEKYIDHYLPEGTYTFTSMSKWCMFYVRNNTGYKNSSGGTEYNQKDIKLNYNESTDVTINSNQHISLTLGTQVKIVKH